MCYRIFAFTLLFLILARTCAFSIIKLNFELNQSYFAENLCEDKDEPASLCNGKCVLAQKLNSTKSKQEQQTPEFNIPHLSIEFLMDIRRIYNSPQWLLLLDNIVVNYFQIFFDQYEGCLLKPPQ